MSERHQFIVGSLVADATTGRRHGRVRVVRGRELEVEWADGKRGPQPVEAIISRYTTQSSNYGPIF